MSTSEESLKETGRCAAASIVEMVAALECDYDRLEELAKERADFMAEFLAENPGSDLDDAPAMDDELKELIEATGECTSREDAKTRIQEDALSVEVRSDWFMPGAVPNDRCAEPWEFRILLATGGPAVRIMGELDNGEPCRAWLEVQDWGTPWTQYFGIEQDTLLAYARCFYYGEG